MFSYIRRSQKEIQTLSGTAKGWDLDCCGSPIPSRAPLRARARVLDKLFDDPADLNGNTCRNLNLSVNDLLRNLSRRPSSLLSRAGSYLIYLHDADISGSRRQRIRNQVAVLLGRRGKYKSIHLCRELGHFKFSLKERHMNVICERNSTRVPCARKYISAFIRVFMETVRVKYALSRANQKERERERKRLFPEHLSNESLLKDV